jgi:hypothetical protein
LVGCKEPHTAATNERRSHDRLNGRAAAALSAKMNVPVRRIGFLIMPLKNSATLR